MATKAKNTKKQAIGTELTKLVRKDEWKLSMTQLVAGGCLLNGD